MLERICESVAYIDFGAVHGVFSHRVEVALTPGRRRCSRCNSTVCVSHTQNRTGSPAPHRLARAASAVAEDSGRSSGAERSEDGWGTHSPERLIDNICKGISSQFVRFLKEEEYCDKWLQFKIHLFLNIFFKCSLFLWCKTEFSTLLLQSSGSHDSSEIILWCWFGAQETFLIWKQFCCLICFLEHMIYCV